MLEHRHCREEARMKHNISTKAQFNHCMAQQHPLYSEIAYMTLESASQSASKIGEDVKKEELYKQYEEQRE